MANQDDESAPTTFVGGLKSGFLGTASAAAKGAALAGKAIINSAPKSEPVGLAPAPGEDHSNFPDDGK